MADTLDNALTETEQNEVKELVSLFMVLPKEDRAILLSNANAFKVRRDIEMSR